MNKILKVALATTVMITAVSAKELNIGGFGYKLGMTLKQEEVKNIELKDDYYEVAIMEKNRLKFFDTYYIKFTPITKEIIHIEGAGSYSGRMNECYRDMEILKNALETKYYPEVHFKNPRKGTYLCRNHNYDIAIRCHSNSKLSLSYHGTANFTSQNDHEWKKVRELEKERKEQEVLDKSKAFDSSKI